MLKDHGSAAGGTLVIIKSPLVAAAPAVALSVVAKAVAPGTAMITEEVLLLKSTLHNFLYA